MTRAQIDTFRNTFHYTDLPPEEILKLIRQCRPVLGPGCVFYEQAEIEPSVIERVCYQLLAAMGAIEAGLNVCKAYEQPDCVGCPNTAGAIRKAIEAELNSAGKRKV